VALGRPIEEEKRTMPRRHSRSLVLSVLALLVMPGVVGARATHAQTSDPAAVVEAYIAAANAHGVDAVLAVYAPDAVHVVMPPPPNSSGIYVGHDQIRTFYEGTVANNDHLEVVAGTLRVEGNTVTYVKRVGSDPWRKLGLETLDLNIYAVVKDGKFTTYIAMMTPESVARLFAALGIIATGTPPAGTPATQ
jgi:hypothetical protein